jgi:hypothetical protein
VPSMGRVANAMLLSTAALAATPAAAAAGGAGAREGPCDITGKAGNPCVAAHSTTRALYAAYDGPLYRVTYGRVCAPCVHHKGSQCCSAGNDTDIGLLEPRGFANISTQDAGWMYALLKIQPVPARSRTEALGPAA